MEIYILIALFIAFLWGLHPIVNKYLLNKYEPFTIMLLASLVYFGTMVVVSILRWNEIQRDLNKMSTYDFTILSLLAFFAVFVANTLYYYILRGHTSSIVSALIFSGPAFTLVISYFILKEKLSLYGLLGILSIILGVTLISQN